MAEPGQTNLVYREEPNTQPVLVEETDGGHTRKASFFFFAELSGWFQVLSHGVLFLFSARAMLALDATFFL